MNNIKSRLKTQGLQHRIRLWKTTERNIVLIAVNQLAWTWPGHRLFILVFDIHIGNQSRVRRVGKSESDDIFVSELKDKELMITWSSVFLSLFQWENEMLILSPWVP